MHRAAVRAAIVLWTSWTATAGCRLDMHDQPRSDPLEASTFFTDGMASRTAVAGTIARGELREDDHLYRGRVDGELARSLPVELEPELLARGRSRYDIFCSPCHDRTGSGHGMVVQRGFKSPPSFHTERLRQAPVGHFFDVITNGFGAMYDYRARIDVSDRWAIVAYVRALQYSQFAPVTDLTDEERTRLKATRTPGATP